MPFNGFTSESLKLTGLLLKWPETLNFDTASLNGTPPLLAGDDTALRRFRNGVGVLCAVISDRALGGVSGKSDRGEGNGKGGCKFDGGTDHENIPSIEWMMFSYTVVFVVQCNISTAPKAEQMQ